MPLSKKQNEYIREANCRWNFKIGAVRSGKSYVDTDTIIPMRIRERTGKSGLNVILGVSRETVERNVLQPMREIYTDKIVSTINSRNIAVVCGEPVYCLGAEKISQVAKIQGSSIKYCYGDEVAKWNPEVFNMLKSRLDKQYSCFDGTCNPESPSHWLKEFIDNEDFDSYIQHYTIFDNPFLPRTFIENLCKEYEGTVYYGRYIEGNWVLAEGLVFPKYEDGLYDELPDLPVEDCSISLDYGTLNPFAGLLWEKRGGVWYAVKELYYSGRDTGIQLTDGEYLDMMTGFAESAIEFQKQNPYKSPFGGKSLVPKVPVIIDPSAASMITLLQKSGMFQPIPAINDVLTGIHNTNLAIQRGLIKINRKNKTFIQEAQSYVWDDRSEEDQVIKANDHLMDAMRYFVETKQLIK